jgi:predicted transposase YdaD
MELVSTVIIYKFTNLSRDEVYAMLSYTTDDLKQTRVYREIYQEVQEEERLSLILTTATGKGSGTPTRSRPRPDDRPTQLYRPSRP